MKTSIRTIALASFAALLLSTGAAFAGEGNGDPFGLHLTTPTQHRIVMVDTGAAAYPTQKNSADGQFSTHELLPSIGSMEIVQTRNSLPRGFAG